MSVVTLQDIVYPVLAALSFTMCILLVLTHLLVDRTIAILALAIYFLVQSVAFIWLALVTGNAPWLDIELFRIWILYTRMVMAGVLIICIALQTIRIWRQR